jgi:hypothetical protein
MRATISGLISRARARICHDFSSSSSAHCHFRPDPAASPGDRGVKIRTFTGKNRPPNRAFARAPNRRFDALKYTQKIPFIQQLVDRYFALGAWRLSWHK